MHHFFVESSQIQVNQIVITGKDVNHMKNVLRMKVGEELSVSNGLDGKEYRCSIEQIFDESILCTLHFVKEDGVELPSRVFLFQGLPKADKMEWIIQKAVELGVNEIIPVRTKRSVVKWDEKKADHKLARWQGIAEAAAKQSKRGVVPQVKGAMTMKEAVAYAADAKVKMIPYELAEGMRRTKDIIGSIHPGDDVAVFIGPEGGFDHGEIKLARAGGVIPVTMGKRILRTETAGMTMLSWITYQLED